MSFKKVFARKVFGFPFYKYPVSRKIFKQIFRFAGKATGRDVSVPFRSLSPRHAEILSELRNQGFFFAQPRDFSPEFQGRQRAAMDQALDLIERGLATNQGSKNYLLNLDLAQAPLEAVRSFYELFASPEIENLASAYLGEKALMVELKVLLSPPTQMPDKDGSQLWHSDFDDDSDLKFFIFLDEVTEDSGPLQVIGKQASRRLMKQWGYRWGVPGISHNDSIVPAEANDQIVSLVGQAGSIVLVDAVQCLHRGSRNPRRARKILYATFNTRTSFRFPPYHWLQSKKPSGPNQSPLLHLDPRRAFITGLALND